MISDEFSRLTMLISNEKKTREETEEAFLDMLRSVINKVKNELETEKREREKTEETLLTLLEETCQRLDEASRIWVDPNDNDKITFQIFNKDI